MAQDEMDVRGTNSAWLRRQNEYQLLIDAQKRIDDSIGQGCILYIIAGKKNTPNPCECDCEQCIQRWLNTDRR